MIVAARLPDGFVCPHCGGERHSSISSRDKFQCSACRKQTSAIAGTIFAATKARLELHEMRGAIAAGRLKTDGKVVLPLRAADYQLTLTAHFGQPMMGQWDALGVVACLVLAIGGTALGAWGIARRDIAR